MSVPNEPAKNDAEGPAGEKQKVTITCPTRAEQAGKGAGYSFWAFYRESLEEAIQTYQPTHPTCREIRVPHTR